MKVEKYITVFGSSIPKEGDAEYEVAYKLGKILGSNGFGVCSGGFQGVMDAVSKGAVENGSRAIGVTLNIYNSTPSKYLSENIVCSSLFERLTKLIEIGEGFIVLQGGTGTLLELALIWEYINKSMVVEKPFACHGDLWNKIAPIMEAQIEREKRKTGLLKCFNLIEDCADYIIGSLKNKKPH